MFTSLTSFPGPSFSKMLWMLTNDDVDSVGVCSKSSPAHVHCQDHRSRLVSQDNNTKCFISLPFKNKFLAFC